jgi:hypothetical protein
MELLITKSRLGTVFLTLWILVPSQCSQKDFSLSTRVFCVYGIALANRLGYDSVDNVRMNAALTLALTGTQKDCAIIFY